MQYLTINQRKETIERIIYYEGIKENLIDARAELEEVRKRDPNVRTKAASESSSKCSGSSDRHDIAIILIDKEKALEKKISDFITILNDYDRGYRLLDDNEKEIIQYKYKQHMTYKDISAVTGYSIQRLKQINNSMLNKMQNQILWY